MKKIIIGISSLSIMSFTIGFDKLEELYYGNQLKSAINNIEEMQEWIIQDVENGKMTVEYSELYYDVLNETRSLVLDYYEHECK